MSFKLDHDDAYAQSGRKFTLRMQPMKANMQPRKATLTRAGPGPEGCSCSKAAHSRCTFYQHRPLVSTADLRCAVRAKCWGQSVGGNARNSRLCHLLYTKHFERPCTTHHASVKSKIQRLLQHVATERSACAWSLRLASSSLPCTLCRRRKCAAEAAGRCAQGA